MKHISLCIIVLTFSAVLSPASPAEDIQEAIEAIGQSLEQGKYKGVTSGLVSHKGRILFEAYAPGTFAYMQHDIRSGLACNDWVPSSVGNEDKMYPTQDWAAFILKQPTAFERGKHFSYCTGGVVMLGRVIRQLLGKPVPIMADEFLFKPLGIEGTKWGDTPQGFTDTGGHLRLTSRDLHKIGLLVAHGGVWHGNQLVPSDWIADMRHEHTGIYERREKFGYLWWLESRAIASTDVKMVFAHGNGGNFIFIVSKLELVAVFTGVNFGLPSQFTVKHLFTREIIPAFINAAC